MRFDFLMGDLPQSKRLRIVDEVKKGYHKFLVATDVAARGLHIDELEMVINYDVPLEAESYIHRIGRTARAGRKGKTITMACEEYVYGLGPIEKLLGRKIPVSWADESLILEDKSAGMSFPPQQRYREFGRAGRSGVRTGGDSRRSREVRYRDQKRPAKGSKPSAGRKSLDPRAARIQSSVSSVAGGAIEDILPDTKREKLGADNGSDRSHHYRPRNNASRRNRRDEEGPKPSEKKPSRQTGKGEEVGKRRISPDSSIDERLNYYRQKYGEDFKIITGSSISRKKGAGKSRKGRKTLGRKPPVPKDPVKKDSGAKGEVPREPQKSVPEPKKKGFLGRLFGKN